MPKIKANNITINYEQQGTGEALLLIPYLAADNACYAFQVADYAKQFTCISLDPRGAGESDKPAGAYSTELFADDIAAFIAAVGLDRVHVAGHHRSPLRGHDEERHRQERTDSVRRLLPCPDLRKRR